MTDPQYHRLYDEEFFDAIAVARGAYIGTYSMAGLPHADALDAAITEAFNAGVQVGKDNPDA